MTGTDERVSRPGGSSWLMPLCMLVLTVTAAVSWSVLRPGTHPFSEASSPPPDVPVREASAQFSFDRPADSPYESARLDVRSEDDVVTVTAFATKRGRTETPLGSRTCPPAGSCTTAVDKDLTLVLLPGSAGDVGSLDKGRVHAQYLDAVDRTAVAVESTQNAHPERLIWRAEDGLLHDSQNSEIAEVQVSAGVYAITIFEVKSLGVWGYFDRRNGVWVARPLGKRPVELVGTAGTGTFDGQRFTEASWVGLLPVGASHPKLATDKGVVWQAAPLGATGRLALAVFVDSARASRIGVRSITYTDATGVRRTVAP
jgi:hypothetical protein